MSTGRGTTGAGTVGRGTTRAGTVGVGTTGGRLPRLLLAESDRDVARYLLQNLSLDGLQVEVVHDGLTALRRASTELPDLVLAASPLDGLDGLELVRRLRASSLTAALPAIVLTEQDTSGSTVAALLAGADDCVAKPFDTLELLARVRTVLRRTADVRELSPLTGLPGNHRIDAEIASLASRGLSYAVCYVDLDEFKSFNDAYGFQRGDGLLLALAGCLTAAAERAAEPPVFVGHVGGDDFVVVCTPQQAESLGAAVVTAFDALLPGHYDSSDVARGCLEVVDRRGELRRHPLVTVSVGIPLMTGGSRQPREVVAAAAEMKSVAKRQLGSVVAVDRRH